MSDPAWRQARADIVAWRAGAEWMREQASDQAAQSLALTEGEIDLRLIIARRIERIALPDTPPRPTPDAEAGG